MDKIENWLGDWMTDKPKSLTLVQGRIVDARCELLSKNVWDAPKVYNHAVLCNVGMPYRDPGDDVRVFERSSGGSSYRVAIRMEAGALPSANGDFIDQGLPFGKNARLLLLHLCSEAIKTQSPIVEVEDSFTAFVRSIGLPTNGQNIKRMREQVARMSVVNMRLLKKTDNHFDMFSAPVFTKLRAEFPSSARQRVLWTSFVEFSSEFYQSLQRHAVPLRMEAISAIKNSSRSLDIYMWLAHRLWRVPAKVPVDLKWSTLRWQFGHQALHMKSFKTSFKNSLRDVLMVYPEAKVSVIHGGIRLEQSRPPVPMTKKRELLR